MAAVTGDPGARASSARDCRVIAATSVNPQSTVTRSIAPSGSILTTNPGRWLRALPRAATSRWTITSSARTQANTAAPASHSGPAIATRRADAKVGEAVARPVHHRRHNRLDTERPRDRRIGGTAEHLRHRSDLPEL